MIRQNVFEKSFDLHPNLKNLNIWTLVIHGDFDPIPPMTAQSIHENIKNSKYILIKDCGPFPYVERPGEFLTRLKDF
jgi:proline iminopeptidase